MTFGLPAAYAAFVWWFTTGLILLLDGLPQITFRWSMTGATAVMLGTLYALHLSAADVTGAGAYTAFSCAILIWGWLEMSFLMGFITGPRKHACIQPCSRWRHFRHAAEAVIYNEIATLTGALVVLAATWAAPNRFALWAYLILWTMRLSAKLNLFLGVPNLGEKFLPAHLNYLKSFFRRRPMNPLFPISVGASMALTVVLGQRHVRAHDAFQSTGYALLTSLLALGVLEHWFMVIPLPSEKLWNWAFKRAPAANSIALACAVGGVLMALATSWCDAASTVHSSVARGKYVALAADCQSCHTAPGGQPFAGGNPLKSAFGTIYGANITSDVGTGIGTWTQADFERALRQGVRKDGAYLYPAMPYNSYTKLTAADMASLWAYIRSIAPVHNTVPKNALPFPLSVRKSLAVWQSLYFKPGAFKSVATKGVAWNRGAYLVQALGHCDACHTPRNVAQGLETKHELTGAQIEGWYAPDISNDPLSKITGLSTDDLAKFLKTGTLPGNVKSFGPMQEVVHDSLRYLTDADLHAMAEYLKDQQDNVEPQSPTPVKYARLGAGKRVYQDNCIACHQANGKGLGGSVPALAGNEAVTAAEPYNVVMAVLEGFPPQGTWGAMGSFADALSDDQIADVANYVRTSWGNNGTPNATPWSVESWRKNANANSQSHALLCPSLATHLMQPALGAGPVALKEATTDRAKMSKLVSSYRSALPKTSTADVIEALSTAYCRAVAEDPISEARMSAQISDFAQQVAVVLTNSR